MISDLQTPKFFIDPNYYTQQFAQYWSTIKIVNQKVKYSICECVIKYTV